MPGSGPDRFASSVKEIVASLRQDPVLVEEVMGNGHTAEIAAALREKAAASAVPVYVVLTKAPAGLTTDNTAEELVSLLRSEAGLDGVWLVATSQDPNPVVRAYGDLWPNSDNESRIDRSVSTELEKAVDRDCGPACTTTPAAEAAARLDILAAPLDADGYSPDLTAEQIDAYTETIWVDADEPYDDSGPPAGLPTIGLSAVVATTVGLCVAVVGYRLLQALMAGFAGARQKSKATPTVDHGVEVGQAADVARRVVNQLGKRLERSGGAPMGQREIARECLDRATPLLESTDLLDLVGAEVLAQTGLRALKDDASYRCCYVDPRHGSSTTESPLGGGMAVPVCEKCAGDLRSERPLRALAEPGRFGRRTPYYTGDSVWAKSGFGALGGDWWRELPR